MEMFGAPVPPDSRLRTQLALDGANVIGFIGSFYDYEGLDDLIAAMPHLLARRPDAKLLLVVGGPMEDALRAQADTSPAVNHIIFAGRFPHGEVADYYSMIDVLTYHRKERQDGVQE